MYIGETWFLDAGVLLRKDRKGTITRFELAIFVFDVQNIKFIGGYNYLCASINMLYSI